MFHYRGSEHTVYALKHKTSLHCACCLQCLNSKQISGDQTARYILITLLYSVNVT